MDLRDTTSYLLRAPDVGKWLRLADNYMQTYNRMPETFVLPAEHSVVQPIIEAFAKDTAAFADYIRALRDGSTGIAYDELHALYRTISIRALQVERRTRVRSAVMIIINDLQELVGRAIKYDEQLKVAKIIEQIWGDMRMSLMARERSLVSEKRLAVDDRAVLLAAFWRDIDNKLARGEVPLGDRNINDIAMELQT